MWKFFKKTDPRTRLHEAIAAYISLIQSDTIRLLHIAQELKNTTNKLNNIEKNLKEVSDNLELSIDSSIEESLLEEKFNSLNRRESNQQLIKDIEQSDIHFRKIRSKLRKISMPTVDVEPKLIDQQINKIRKQILKIAKKEIIFTNDGYLTLANDTDQYQIKAELRQLNFILATHKKVLETAQRFPQPDNLNKRKNSMLVHFKNVSNYFLGSVKNIGKVAPLPPEEKPVETKPIKLFKKR